MKIIRLPRLIAGLFFYSIGIALTIQANMGVAPWDTFHQGLTNILDITFGQASICTGLLIVIINIFFREKIGLGTILNMIVIGLFLDYIFAYGYIPKTESIILGFGMMTLGMFIIAIATWLYIGSGLGTGPRDGLMVALTKKTGLPVGIIRGCIELCVLAIGFTLGGQIGIGTAFMAFGIGPIIQFTFKILNFNVKEITHTYIQIPSYVTAFFFGLLPSNIRK